MSTNEAVDHPNYYGGDVPYEVIKVVVAWNLGFCLGNALKYIGRAGKKDATKHLEDLKKALWYVNYARNHDEHSSPSPGVEGFYAPLNVMEAWGLPLDSRLRAAVRGIAFRSLDFTWDALVLEIARLKALPAPEPVISPLQVATDIRTFHFAGEVPMPNIPAFPGLNRIELRKKLVEEECQELLDAIDARDLVEVVDGCVDLVVVTVGTLLEFGVDPTSAWNEVQRSNMAKYPPCTACDGTDDSCEACSGRGTLLFVRDDGKILKPEGWTPPDIRSVLLAQGAHLYPSSDTGWVEAGSEVLSASGWSGIVKEVLEGRVMCIIWGEQPKGILSKWESPLDTLRPTALAPNLRRKLMADND